MIKIFLPALLLIGLTASCQNSDGGGQGGAVPASSTASSPAPNAPMTTSSAQPGMTSDQGVALNPPHGEPGHVCEIPVGEPLDGSGPSGGRPHDMMIPPPQGSPQEITINPSDFQGGGVTTVTPNMTTPSGSTPPGINPPHGEPGHVCEIPVGEPLP